MVRGKMDELWELQIWVQVWFALFMVMGKLFNFSEATFPCILGWYRIGWLWRVEATEISGRVAGQHCVLNRWRLFFVNDLLPAWLLCPSSYILTWSSSFHAFIKMLYQRSTSSTKSILLMQDYTEFFHLWVSFIPVLLSYFRVTHIFIDSFIFFPLLSWILLTEERCLLAICSI